MPRKLKETKTKGNRRGNNEGSIYKRKDGRWCAQITIGYQANGKIIRKTLYGKSRQEVARQLSQCSSEVFNNGYTQFTPKASFYFTDLLNEWFITFKAPNIGSSTEEKLRGFIKNHIGKVFKDYEIQNMDLMQMQRFFNEKSKILCIQSFKHMKQLLNQFFEYAVKKKIVNTNPITDVRIKENAKQFDEETKKH